jgi:ferric-dicitrate binding protein FerR (iron transport regulator)
MKRLALALSLVALMGAARPPAATVQTVVGPVTWHAAGASQWQAARPGLGLMAGSVVRTGARGMVRLRWANGGEFRLDPLSEVTVAGRDGIDVQAGQVWAKFRSKLTIPFLFQSPSATAVIRGTVLGFGVDEQGGTHVDVQEGHVGVRGHGGPMADVGPGQRVLVSPDGQVGPVGPRGADAPTCNP